jgi:protein-L-isoaspartate(D-aspartate) O-methyltransferase
MAEVVGSQGRVTAIEIDSPLATRARGNLAYLSQVIVVEGDGGEHNPGLCDAILVDAGATHPPPMWLDSLEIRGRLIVPLTVSDEAQRGAGGFVLKVLRKAEGYTASFITSVGIFPCVGARDPQLNEKLKEAFKRGDRQAVQSLRRDSHEATDTCWLHGENFCLSRLRLKQPAPIWE